MKYAFLFLLTHFFFDISLAQTQSSLSLPKMNPDSLQMEWKSVFEELRSKHPGFYRYQNPADFDTLIAETIRQIDHPMDEWEVYRIMKPVIARIGCLHTGIALSEETETLLNKQEAFLPLGVYFQGDNAFVSAVFVPGSSLQPGDELVRINGKSIQSIRDTLLAHIPMDGFNRTGKVQLLNRQFASWFRLFVPSDPPFNVETCSQGLVRTYTLGGISADQLPSYETHFQDTLHFQVFRDYAYLRIPSFARSAAKEQGLNFKKMIRTGFAAMRQGEIEHLVIDLRGNTGGSDSHAAFLASFLFDNPFRYWEKIEVTASLAQDIKGINRLFYGKPIPGDSLWQWTKSGFFTREFDFYEEQNPAKVPFTGNVYVLIDGLCMSSCADFAAILYHNRRATFYGEETGGGYQGNTSGLIPETSLPSGIQLSVPLLKYTNAVDKEENVGRGTPADISVYPTIEDILNANDPVYDYVKGLFDPSP